MPKRPPTFPPVMAAVIWSRGGNKVGRRRISGETACVRHGADRHLLCAGCRKTAVAVIVGLPGGVGAWIERERPQGGAAVVVTGVSGMVVERVQGSRGSGFRRRGGRWHVVGGV